MVPWGPWPCHDRIRLLAWVQAGIERACRNAKVVLTESYPVRKERSYRVAKHLQRVVGRHRPMQQHALTRLRTATCAHRTGQGKTPMLPPV